MTSPQRHALIDALKAVVSQLIVLHHLAFYGPMADYATPLAPEAMDWLFQYARIAVQTFLVMGGYLAAQSLACDGLLIHRPLGLIIFKRYAKLVPPYLAALIAALIAAALARQLMSHASIPDAPSTGQLITHLFLLHGIFGFDGLSAGVWYVGIDFQLYSLLACTLWLTRKFGSQAITASRVLMLVLIAASLFVFNRDSSWDNWAIYFIGAYGLGAMAFWCVRPGHLSPWFIAALAIGASGLAFDFRSRIAVALVTAIALALTRFWPTLAAWPRLPLLGWLGNISYSVFLIHFPVCLLINAVFERFVPHTPGLQLFGMLVAWACSLAAGALFHQKIELPAQRWLSAQRSLA